MKAFTASGITKPHVIMVNTFFVSVSVSFYVFPCSIKGIWLEPTLILFKWPYFLWSMTRGFERAMKTKLDEKIWMADQSVKYYFDI